ncbi:MAG: nitroreductase [Firmicutes bacterium]|nr:nitroreductase [Bacillota bacterium]
MSEVINVIKRRRSVRAYQEEQIKEHELQAILEAGLWAPSAHNSQPWHLTVIQDPDLIRYISEVSIEDMVNSSVELVARLGQSGRSIFYNAPTVIIVSGKKEGLLDPVIDCSAAVQNMLLAAEALDIGSCWIGLIRFFFNHEEDVKKLQLPEEYKPFYAVCLGYKAQPNGQGAARTSNTVSYIH